MLLRPARLAHLDVQKESEKESLENTWVETNTQSSRRHPIPSHLFVLAAGGAGTVFLSLRILCVTSYVQITTPLMEVIENDLGALIIRVGKSLQMRLNLFYLQTVLNVYHAHEVQQAQPSLKPIQRL
jgi:hypothetical protein